MIEYNEKKAVQNEEPDIKPHKLFRRYRPKYLKKPEKRKSLRALTCFALIFAALTASAAGTYAKYISDPVTVEPFSIQAAQFACEVKDLTIDDKEKYGLKNTDVVVQAFTVSNEKNGVRSEVDLSVDVNLAGLTGTYTAEVDLSSSGFWQTEEMKKNAVFVSGLKSKLIVGEIDGSGNFEALDTQPVPESISNSPFNDLMNHEPGIMQITPFPVTADCHNEWKDAFSIPCDGNRTYIGIIIIDTNVVDSTLGPLTYTGPDLKLSGTSNNLTVTVNQAKTSA